MERCRQESAERRARVDEPGSGGDGEGGFLRSAEEYFQVAKLCAPTYSLVYVNLGVLYGATGRGDLARLNFEEAIRLAPGDANSYTYYNEWRRMIQSRGAK